MFQPNEQANVKILPGHFEPLNLESRVHAVPIFDFSGSMSEHAPKLPGAWRQMVASLCKQTIDRLRIELACCVFDTQVVFQDYAPLPFFLEKALTLTGGGSTSLGTALLTAIELTRQRRKMLASEGIHSRRAVCPVVTDGYATDHEALQHAVRQMSQSETLGEIEFIFLAPDNNCLAQLTTVFAKDPILLGEVRFDRLFGAFTRSLSSYSRSRIGHEPQARQLLVHELRPSSQETE